MKTTSDKKRGDDLIRELFSTTPGDEAVDKQTCHSAIFIGASKSGKTTRMARILQLIEDRYDLILFFSYSLHDPIYDFIDRGPDSKYALFDVFVPDVIKEIFKINKQTDNAIQTLIIFDDMIGNKVRESDIVLQCMTRGRNSGISMFFSSQSATMIAKNARGNANYVFLLSNNAVDMRTTVVEKFLYGVYPTPPELTSKGRKIDYINRMLVEHNRDHGCVVIDNLAAPPRIYHLKKDD